MTSSSEDAEAVEKLLETPDLATALESEQFKKFLDQVPIGIAVSNLNPVNVSSTPGKRGQSRASLCGPCPVAH